MFSLNLSKELSKAVGTGKYSTISVNDVFTAVSVLKLEVRNLWFHGEESIAQLAK
jgi:hypothetical protein